MEAKRISLPDRDLSYFDEKTPEFDAQRINCHHNFTQIEHHFGHDVWVTRKGAIHAKRGQWALIPGSMGTRSYKDIEEVIEHAKTLIEVQYVLRQFINVKGWPAGCRPRSRAGWS